MRARNCRTGSTLPRATSEKKAELVPPGQKASNGYGYVSLASKHALFAPQLLIRLAQFSIALPLLASFEVCVSAQTDFYYDLLNFPRFSQRLSKNQFSIRRAVLDAWCLPSLDDFYFYTEACHNEEHGD